MELLTVQQAAKATGRSTAAIRRRIIYPITKDDKHPDREHIQPSADEAAELRMKGMNFPWKISDELVRRLIPTDENLQKKSDARDHKTSSEYPEDLLAVLRRELDIKNQQITQQSEMLSRQMELINGLSERLREENVLIGTLQQRLALVEGAPRARTTFVDADAQKSGVGESAPKKKMKPKAKSEKRRIFSGWFR